MGYLSTRLLRDASRCLTLEHTHSYNKCIYGVVGQQLQEYFILLKTFFENWNMSLVSTCVFINFSRTIDSIDHDIFLGKMRLYGLDDKCITFLSSYNKCTIDS